jgi:transposase
MKKVYYVGMDVHKETVEISVFLNSNREPEFEKRLPNDHRKIIKLLKKYQQPGQVKACYEAGCMGFTLKRACDEAGIDCQIVSPGKLPRKPGDRIKTDRRDARILAKTLRAGEADGIYVPTLEDEAARDYIRARDDIKNELKRVKQQLLKFLLRYGYEYGTGSYWTRKHRSWMKEIEFTNKLQQKTFQAYYTRMVETEQRLVLMDAEIVEISQTDRYRQAVNRLRCFKGIDHLVALAIVCEIGDFKRFARAEGFMAFLGLVPREHSSGDKRRQGGITKSGNGHLRRLLVEASWHYRYPCAPSKRLTARRTGQDIEIISYADRAMRRLQKKFSKMLLRGKTKNVSVIAVSRERAGFVWGLMNNKIEAA